MNRKIVSIPVSKHIAHFMAWEFGFNKRKHIVIPSNFILKHDPKNSHHARNYFERCQDKPNMVEVEVEYFGMVKIQQLCLIRQMEELFTSRMVAYVHRSGEGPYEAIREFLFVVLNLDEEDFKFSRAYKRYQRHLAHLKSRDILNIANDHFPAYSPASH